MFALTLLMLTGAAHPDPLPVDVDLRHGYEKYGLSVCQQNGPLCWDYTVVGLLEYELATQRDASTRLSPGFLEWAASATDSESSAGSNFGRAYRGLERFGIAPLSLGGDPDKAGHGPAPDDSTLRAASSLGRIDIRWIRFWNNADELTKEQFEAIESEIANGHPVAIGLRWPNKTTFSPPNSYVLTVPARGDVFDGHCVALVGYTNDSSLPGGGAFLFRNSWGAKWADRGYAWMPFALLKFCINDALSVRLWPLHSAGFDSKLFAACQLKISGVLGPSPSVQDMRTWGKSWTNNRQLFFTPQHVGQQFGLEVPVEKAGQYTILVVITRAQDYGTFSLGVDGADNPSVPVDIDGAGPGVSRSNPIPCGPFQLKAGTNRVVFTVTGHGSASHGLNLGLDSIELVPAH